MAQLDDVVGWIADLEGAGLAQLQRAQRALLDCVEISLPMLRKASGFRDRPLMAVRAATLLAQVGDLQAAPALTRLLHVPEAKVRQLALQALLTHPSVEASGALLLLAQGCDESPQGQTVRATALNALARCLAGDETFILDDVRPFLDASDKFVRAATARVIGQLHSSASAEILLSRLDDDDAFVRDALRNALVRTGVTPQQVPLVLASLRRGLSPQAPLLRALAAANSSALLSDPRWFDPIRQQARAYLYSDTYEQAAVHEDPAALAPARQSFVGTPLPSSASPRSHRVGIAGSDVTKLMGRERVHERASAALHLLDRLASLQPPMADTDLVALLRLSQTGPQDLRLGALAVLASHAHAQVPGIVELAEKFAKYTDLEWSGMGQLLRERITESDEAL